MITSMYTQGKSANTSVALCFDMFVTEHNLSMNIFVLNTHTGYRIEYYFKMWVGIWVPIDLPCNVLYLGQLHPSHTLTYIS